MTSDVRPIFLNSWTDPFSLFLKRDNGGNLNHGAVNGVLAEFFVLPLNSPGYYAPYNGAIEESQRELKACLREKLIPDLPCSENHSPVVYAEVAAHDLNHRLRPCLRGKTSCQVFFSLGEKPAFSKLERREIYGILMERVGRILASMNQFDKSAREAAWRIAVEFWLQSKEFIHVHIPPKVSPNFTPIFDSAIGSVYSNEDGCRSLVAENIILYKDRA